MSLLHESSFHINLIFLTLHFAVERIFFPHGSETSLFLASLPRACILPRRTSGLIVKEEPAAHSQRFKDDEGPTTTKDSETKVCKRFHSGVQARGQIQKRSRLNLDTVPSRKYILGMQRSNYVITLENVPWA